MPTVIERKPERTVEGIDDELRRVREQDPRLLDQHRQESLALAALVAQHEDALFRALVLQDADAVKELAGLDEHRTHSAQRLEELGQALKQIKARLAGLEEEKAAIVRQRKSAERLELLAVQRALAVELDALLTDSVMPKLRAFMARGRTLYGLNTELGEGTGATPKEACLRVVRSYFAPELRPALEPPSFRCKFADLVPKPQPFIKGDNA